MPWWRMFLPAAENYIVEQLVASSRFRAIAKFAHRRVHKLKTGEDLPVDVDRTSLTNMKHPEFKIYMKYFFEELGNSLKNNPPKR